MIEIVSGDARLPLVANRAAELIEAAVEQLGLGVDVAVSILCQVAADYGRSEYGDAFLPGLADVVTERAKMPLPPAENPASIPSEASAGNLPPDDLISSLNAKANYADRTFDNSSLGELYREAATALSALRVRERELVDRVNVLSSALSTIARLSADWTARDCAARALSAISKAQGAGRK